MVKRSQPSNSQNSHDFNALIISSLERIEIRIDNLDEQMRELIKITNHRLDDFSKDLLQQKLDFNKELQNKVNITSLLNSLIIQLISHSQFRWGLGLFFTGLIGTAT